MYRFRFTAGIWDRSLSYFSRRHTKKLITMLVLTAGTLGASAAPSLSRVSCSSNAYSAPGTDACSIYLTARTRSRIVVSLTSNNPAVTVPGAVTVRSEATGFTASVSAVTTAQTATITAEAEGITATFNITVSPASSGTPALSINASSIGFGDVQVNTAAEQSLTLTSTGTAAATVTSANITGAGFSISRTTVPVTLNPGQAMTVQVGFDPASAGTFSGQLSFASNASVPAVALNGAGTALSVDLSWTAPSSPNDPIAGYNVYRASSGTTSFQRLNTSAETQTGYSDSSVQSGTSYEYYVTSVDSAGNESSPSTTTTVTIP